MSILVGWWECSCEATFGGNIFIKMYHPPEGSSFTSLSTYLQNNSSGSLSYNTWGMRVRVSHMGPNIHLSQSGSWDISFHGCHGISLTTSWPGTFRGKATQPTLVQPSLYILIVLSLNLCGNSGSKFFKKLHHRNPQYKHQLEKNTSL